MGDMELILMTPEFWSPPLDVTQKPFSRGQDARVMMALNVRRLMMAKLERDAIFSRVRIIEWCLLIMMSR